MELWCALNASSTQEIYEVLITLRKMPFSEQTNSQKISNSAWRRPRESNRRNAQYCLELHHKQVASTEEQSGLEEEKNSTKWQGSAQPRQKADMAIAMFCCITLKYFARTAMIV